MADTDETPTDATGSNAESPDGEATEDASPDWDSDRWLASPVLEAALPQDVRSTLVEMLDGRDVETLGDWVDAIREMAVSGSIELDDLCHAASESAHYGELDGERYYFQCFYDAVILSALADEPVDVRTESPDGTVIEARADGTDELTVTPPEAVFSFGVDDTVEATGADDLTPAALYAAVCPYVRAFPTPAAYEAWADRTPAATVAMPLAGATDVAEALVA